MMVLLEEIMMLPALPDWELAMKLKKLEEVEEEERWPTGPLRTEMEMLPALPEEEEVLKEASEQQGPKGEIRA